MQEHLKLLGFKVKDVVSGLEGVVTSISFDLYGCVQAVVSRPTNKDGEIPESRWFDTKRLVAISEVPVMDVPDFAIIPGGQDLPSFKEQPI
jgi:hypothetical protein